MQGVEVLSCWVIKEMPFHSHNLGFKEIRAVSEREGTCSDKGIWIPLVESKWRSQPSTLSSLHLLSGDNTSLQEFCLHSVFKFQKAAVYFALPLTKIKSGLAEWSRSHFANYTDYTGKLVVYPCSKLSSLKLKEGRVRTWETTLNWILEHSSWSVKTPRFSNILVLLQTRNSSINSYAPQRLWYFRKRLFRLIAS